MRIVVLVAGLSLLAGCGTRTVEHHSPPETGGTGGRDSAVEELIVQTEAGTFKSAAPATVDLYPLQGGTARIVIAAFKDNVVWGASFNVKPDDLLAGQVAVELAADASSANSGVAGIVGEDSTDLPKGELDLRVEPAYIHGNLSGDSADIRGSLRGPMVLSCWFPPGSGNDPSEAILLEPDPGFDSEFCRSFKSLSGKNYARLP